MADVVECAMCGQPIDEHSPSTVVSEPVTGPDPAGSDQTVLLEPKRWFCKPEHAFDWEPPEGRLDWL